MNTIAISDYSAIFHSPDELVDFLILPVDRQNEILLQLKSAGKLSGYELSCNLPKTLKQ